MAFDASDEEALRAMSGDDNVTSFPACGMDAVLNIESEICLPGFLVRPMALKTVIGEHGQNIP